MFRRHPEQCRRRASLFRRCPDAAVYGRVCVEHHLGPSR